MLRTFPSNPAASQAAATLAQQWLPSISAVLMLGPQFVKISTTISAIPRWELDPLSVPAELLGFGIAGPAILDVLTLLGAALALSVAPASRPASALQRALIALSCWLIPLGCAAAALFWIIAPIALLHDQRITLAWVSGLCAALAMSRIGADRAVRTITLAAITSLLVILAAKGAVQLLLDHPRTVSNFIENKETILASQGWTPDSPSARGYERRLMQNEPTGWFGLANIFSTFFAAGVGLFATLFAAAFTQGPSKSRTHMRLAAAAMLALCLAAAVAAGSKTGLIMSAAGLASAGCWLLLSRRAQTRAHRHASARQYLAAAAALLLILAVNLAIVARGVLGERIAELSLLFRWFYMEAAWRIFAAAPLTGCGPDGFKERYLIHKNPISPEEVQSPHNIILDYAATLGLAGIALSIGLIVLVMLAAITWWQAAASRPHPQHSASTEPDNSASARHALLRIVCILPVTATLMALWLETAGLPPEQLLLRLGGLALMLLAAHFTCIILWPQAEDDAAAAAPGSSLTTGVPAALACFGILLFLQGLIDLALSSVHSGPFALACIGAGAASLPTLASTTPGPTNPSALPRPASRARWATSLATLALTLTCGYFTLPSFIRWELALKAAAETVRPLAEVSALMQASARSDGAIARAAALAEASEILTLPAQRHGITLGATPESLTAASLALRAPLILESRSLLAAAMSHTRPDFATWREYSRLSLISAEFRFARTGDGPSGEARNSSLPGRGVIALPTEDTAAPFDPALAKSPVRVLIDDALTSGRLLASRRPASVSGWQVTATRAAIAFRPDRQLEHVYAALLIQAQQADPYNPMFALMEYEMFRAQPVAGSEVLGAAERTLKLAALQRLDAAIKSIPSFKQREIEEFVRYFNETGMGPVAAPIPAPPH